ncbi:hypothetical protein PISL3812_07325 [Talaromyces islandicus]|uniref:Uncharacterized protein n=1 Tax=Talaromyces islandicus TaxID=28573 RepID=A0A0U1M4G5_TALIS|nr:hypothetical protein PISL3812_07325 [Talaromyces islandicus]
MYPALWHATTALGAVHVQLNVDGPLATHWSTERGYHGLFALKQCTKSIQSLTRLTAQKDLSEQDRIVILTTCVLFSCLSSLQGYQEQALMHIQSGLKLIRDWGLEEMYLQQRGHPMTSMLLLMFNQLDSQALYTRHALMIKSTPDEHDKLPLTMPLSVGSFASCLQAYAELERLINGFSRIGLRNEGEGGSRNQQTVIQWKQVYSQALNAWDTRFSHFLATTSEQLSENMMTLLRIRRLFISTRFNDSSKGELGYDEFFSRFATIVDLIEKLLGPKDNVTVEKDGFPSSSSPSPQNTTHKQVNISLSIIVSDPLIFTGSRCREPSTRRRALRLLQMYPRREGIVNSILAANLLEAMISFEEKSCSKMQSGSDSASTTSSDTCSTAGRWICSKHRIVYEEFLDMSRLAQKHTQRWRK